MDFRCASCQTVNTKTPFELTRTRCLCDHHGRHINRKFAPHYTGHIPYTISLAVRAGLLRSVERADLVRLVLQLARIHREPDFEDEARVDACIEEIEALGRVRMLDNCYWGDRTYKRKDGTLYQRKKRVRVTSSDAIPTPPPDGASDAATTTVDSDDHGVPTPPPHNDDTIDSTQAAPLAPNGATDPPPPDEPTPWEPLLVELRRDPDALLSLVYGYIAPVLGMRFEAKKWDATYDLTIIRQRMNELATHLTRELESGRIDSNKIKTDKTKHYYDHICNINGLFAFDIDFKYFMFELIEYTRKHHKQIVN